MGLKILRKRREKKWNPESEEWNSDGENGVMRRRELVSGEVEST
jgi:hypothetical protein